VYVVPLGLSRKDLWCAAAASCSGSRPADRRGWSRAYGAMCAWGPGIIAGIETLPHLLDLGTQLFLSLLGPSSTSSSTSPPPPSSLPASPLLVLASPTRLADQTDTSAWRLLSTASSPRARAPVIITHQRPPTFPPPASRHRAS